MAPVPHQADVVIVGSGLGGYTLAREIRKLAPAASPNAPSLLVITADGGEAYAKPMLSNAFAQKKTPAGLIQKPGKQTAAEQGFSLAVRSRVTGIDTAARTLTLHNETGSQMVSYGDLVLAVGADPRPFQTPGSDRVLIHSVNDLDAYGRWRSVLQPGQRILIIGAGLVGAEFANDLAVGGFAVTLVEPGPWPLGRLVPEATGRALQQALQQAGLDLHMGQGVAKVEPGQAGGGIATLTNGTEIAFDHALSAIGLVPRTQLAAQAGLAVDRGIVVDALLKTSDPHVYAIGDCAQTTAGPLPFVAPLMAEAKALAATLTGTATPLVLPALPVVVKTPALPLAVCPPAPTAQGEWVVEGSGLNLKALFKDATGTALGFALTGTFGTERQALGKLMPALIA